MNEHKQIQQLIAIYDSLGRTERSAVDRHIQSCLHCQAHLAAYQRMDTGLDRLVDPKPAASLRSDFYARLEAERPKRSSFWQAFPTFLKRLPSQIAQAGALVVIALIVFSMWLALRSQPEQPAAVPSLPAIVPQPTATPAPANTATPSLPTMTPTPAPPSWTIQQQGILTGQLNVVRAVTIGQEGRYIAASGSSFNSLVWEQVGTPDQYQRTMQKEVAYGASLNSLAFSLQGYLAVGGAEGSEGLVSVRYLTTGDEAFSLPYTIPPVEIVAFSNSGDVIAVGTGRNQSGQNGSVHLWFLNFSDRLYELAFEGDSVNGLAFSPDDSLIAAVSASGVSLWQVTGNDFLRTLTAETSPSPVYSSLAFAPDGLTIAAGSQEGIVYVWQVAGGQRLEEFDTGTKPVQSIAFSADGQQIATVADDGQVTVWQLGGAQPELLFRGQTAERVGLVTDVVFVDEAVLVVVGMADGQVQLWQAAPIGN